MTGIKVVGGLKDSSISGNKFIGIDQAIDIEGDLENTTIDNNIITTQEYYNDVDKIVEKLKEELIKNKDKINTNKKDKIVDIMSNIASNVISEVILKASGLR